MRSLAICLVIPILTVLSAKLMTGCVAEDTGICCTSVTAEGKAKIPMPDNPPPGMAPRDIVRCNLLFECDDALCISYQGGEPMCSRKCTTGAGCPDGFECKPALQSTVPTSTCFHPDDLYCVRKACSAAADCPGGSECATIHEGQGTEDDPTIKQCVKAEHKCAATR